MTMQQVSKGEFDRRVKLLEQKVNESANKLVSDYKEFIERINSVISENPDFNKYAAIVERINSCFDINGQFDGSHIKPLSIETAALSVGQRSQALNLKNVKFEVKEYTRDTNNYGVLSVTDENGNTSGNGTLTHYTLFNDINGHAIGDAIFNVSYSNISIYVQNDSDNDNKKLHYIYAKLECTKANDGTYIYDNSGGNPTAIIIVDKDQRQIEGNKLNENPPTTFPGYLWILLGTISKEFSGTRDGVSYIYRIVDLNYGLTTINGRLITTGRIEGSTQNGAYFDLDAGEIGGNIKFTANNTSTLLNELGFASQTYVSDSINTIKIGGRNLASKINVIKQTTNYTESNYIYQVTAGNGAGLKFPGTIFTANELYVLSFKIKKVSGTQTYIGGHQGGFTCNKFVVDGVVSSRTYSQGQSLANDTNTHKIEVYLKFNGGTNDDYLYIQPNRGNYTGSNTSVFNIWDIMLEKGNKATDWTPAPEDSEKVLYATCDTNGNVQTKVIVCPDLTSDFLSKSNMRMKIKFSKAAGKFASSGNVNLQFEFRSESNGSAIRPNGTNQDIVLMKYHGYTAYDTPSDNLYMPYWNVDQEMEITFSDITNNVLSIKIVDEEIFDTMTSISNAISGTTTIAGGLILTDTIIAGTGSNQAGINGLSTNDVAFWAGGNIGSARNFNTPVVIKRNGDAKFGVVNIDQYSGSLCMIENNNKRLEIKSDVLTYPGTAKVYNPNNSANDAETNTAHRDSGTGISTSISSSTVITKYIFEDSNESDHLITLQPNPTNKYNFYVYLSFSSAKINVTTTSNIGNARIVLEFYNGSEWEIIHTYECNTQYVQEYSFNDELSFKLSYSNYNTLGNAKIGLRAKYNIDNNAIANITLSNPKWYYYQDLNKICTQIAKNGFSLYIGNSNTFSVSTSNEQRLDTVIKGRIQITGDGNNSFITNVTGGISSDIRFKKDINNFNAIELLSKLNFIKFHWNELAKEKLNSDTNQQCYGLIAQNSDGVIDSMVKHEDENFDYQRVDYNLLIPILGKAINELVEKNKLLEERIALLESNQ